MKRKIIILLLFIFCILFFMPSKYIASGSVIGEKVNKENIETKEEKVYSFSKEKENEILEKLKSKDEKVIINILEELFKEISQKTTNEYEKKYGKFKLNKEILEIIKKFSNNQNKQIQYKTFWILERTDLNELKKIIDIYLNSNDQRLRGSAISLIEKDARPDLKEKLIEIAKLPMNEQNELSIYGALRALDNYNDPTIIDRIKSVFEDITEPVETLNEAFRNDDINKINNLLNENVGFLFQIVTVDYGLYPDTILTKKQAIDFFMGKSADENAKYYNIKNITGFDFANQQRNSPYVKKDKKGNIYVYITSSAFETWQPWFYDKKINVVKGKPIVEIKVTLNFIDKNTLPKYVKDRDVTLLFMKEQNKWFLVGMRN